MIATFFSVNDLQKESGSWAFMYNFDQYFYQDKKDPTSRPSKRTDRPATFAARLRLVHDDKRHDSAPGRKWRPLQAGARREITMVRYENDDRLAAASAVRHPLTKTVITNNTAKRMTRGNFKI